MASSEDHEARVKKLIDNKDVEFVRVEIPDANGCSRGVLLNANYFINAYKDGFAEPQLLFVMSNNGLLFANTGYTDEISYEDGACYVNLDTFHVLPWADKTASVLTDFRFECRNPDSPYLPISPRGICKTQLQKLDSLGLRLFSAFEYEFYLLNPDTKKSSFSEINCFSTQLAMKCDPLINDIMRAMMSLGIQPEHYHAEYGPSQHELTMSPVFGIDSSDNAFRYKSLVKEIAAQKGYMATFMSKPFYKHNASSGHFNHSLWDENGKNMLYDADEKYGLSKIAQHWLAGLRYHSDALFCLAAPTPNCVERRNAGAVAPINNAWGLDNRSLAYRVKNSGCDKIYIENRLGASAANPYLLTAGCIIAGMDGIKRKLILEGDPYDGEISHATSLPDHIKSLPNSLSASVDCLINNELFVRELGPEFMKSFSEMKKQEDKIARRERSKENLYQWYMFFYGEYS